MVNFIKNCFLIVSLCCVCGIILIPVTFSLVSPLRSHFLSKSESWTRRLTSPTHQLSPSDQSTVLLSPSSPGNQITLPNVTAATTLNQSTIDLIANNAFIQLTPSDTNGTNFREGDFMVISGSNNASQVSLVSSIFQNSRRPKKNQSRIFFIPIRSLVPISFNGTMVIFDSRSNSTSMQPSTATATNSGNVTFVLIEEDTNATVTASLPASKFNSTNVVALSSLTGSTTTTSTSTTTTSTTTTTTTTPATTTAAATTTSSPTVSTTLATSIISTLPASTANSPTLPPVNIHSLNDRIFFAPIPQVINLPSAPPPPPSVPLLNVSTSNSIKNQGNTIVSIAPSAAAATFVENDRRRSINQQSVHNSNVPNGIPVGLLSKDQASSLLAQFALNSSEQLLNASSPECERQLDETDSCMRTVLLVNGQTKSPTTFDELDSIYCKNLTNLLKCLSGYSKCLHRVPRIIYNFVYLHIKRTLEMVCRNNTFRADIIYHSRCFSSTPELNVVKRIVDQGTLTALYVLKFIPTNNIIGWGCCGYQKTIHDGIQQINAICTQKTGNFTGEFAMGFLKAAASDLIDIGCRRYSSVELCNHNLPQAMATFTQLVSGNIPEQKYSPVIPLIEIARRLSSTID